MYGSQSIPVATRNTQSFTRNGGTPGVPRVTNGAITTAQKTRSGNNSPLTRVTTQPPRPSTMRAYRYVVGIKKIPYVKWVKVRRKDGSIRKEKKIFYRDKKIYAVGYRRHLGPRKKPISSMVRILTPNNFSFMYVQNLDNDQSGSLTLTDAYQGNKDVSQVTGNLVYPFQSLIRNELMGYDISSEIYGSDTNATNRLPLMLLSAQRKLYKRVQGDLPNYAQIIAEREKTLSSVASAAKKVASVALDIYRFKFNKLFSRLAARTSKENAQDYLLGVYGILPTIIDINGVIKDLSGPSGYKASQKISTKIRDNISTSKTITRSRFCTVTVNTTWQLTAKSSIYLSQPQSNFANISTRGLTNPTLLAWELAPFTFVIDWLFNVSSYLSAQSALRPWTVDYYFETTSIRKKVDWTISYGTKFQTFGLTSCTPAMLSGSAEKFIVSRKVLATPPAMPAPELRSPVSFQHSANAIALILSIFTKR